MRRTLALLVVLGLVVPAVATEPEAAAGTVESYVLEIVGYEAYEQAIAEHEVMLLEFYAPWCGHCKKLEPEYEKAAMAFSRMESPIKLAKIDATVEANAKATIINHVKSYPTLMVVNSGELSEYNGARDGLGIVEAMKLRSLPVMTKISSAEDASKLKESVRVALVASFKDPDGESASGWASMAETWRGEFAFGQVVTQDEDVLSSFALQPNRDNIAIWRQFDEGAVQYNGPDNGDALYHWARVYSAPLADRIAPGPKDPDRSWFRKIFWSNEEKILQLVLCLPDGHDGSSPMVATLREVLKKYRGKMHGAYALSDFKELHEFWGVDGNNLPILVLNDENESARYQSKAGTTMDAAGIKDFIEQALAGNIKKSMKSSPIPADTSTSPVVEVVYDNFEEIVMKSKADVMLEIYAPWCGHCKALAPHYERIAHTYRGETRLVVAKMDGSANDLPKEVGEMEGYPKVMLFPSGKKDEPIEYDGKDRTFEPIVDWLMEHSTTGSDLQETEPTLMEKFAEFLRTEYVVTGGQILIFFTVVFVGVLALLFAFADSPAPSRPPQRSPPTRGGNSNNSRKNR